MSATWMRAQEFGQPLMLMVSGCPKSGRRFSSSLDQRRGRGPWSPRWPACRTRCRCRPSCCGGTPRGGPAGPAPPGPRPAPRTLSAATSRISIFCSVVVRTRSEPAASARSAILVRVAPSTRPTTGGEADVEVAVLLLVHADVVALVLRRRLGRRAVGQLPVQVLGLQHLAELRGAPVGDQELQAGAAAQAAVAVVAEHARDAGPDLRDLLQRHEGAQALGEVRVRRQAAADPQVEARAELGVDHADEGDVVDLVHDVLRAADRGLELARQVGELRAADVLGVDLVDRRRGVDDLVLGDAGHRRAQDHAGGVAARLGGAQAGLLQVPPDGRDVLDADPVVLDVLPVGDVGGAARVLLGDLGHGAQLRQAQAAAVDPDAEHEVLVVELVRLQHAGLAAVDAGAALGVQAPPAHAPAQVGAVDRVEAAVGVDVLDPGPHVEPVVVLLELLVGVQRREVALGPLALAALGAGRGRAGRRRGRHGRGRSFGRGCTAGGRGVAGPGRWMDGAAFSARYRPCWKAGRSRHGVG